MRWATPEIDNRRYRRWFAIFPVDTEDAGTVWLELVWVEQVYMTYVSCEPGGAVEAGPAWIPVRFRKERP